MHSITRITTRGFAVFTLVGVGLGLSGMLLITYAQDQFVTGDSGSFVSAIQQLFVMTFALGGMMTTFFTGPTVGALTGLTISGDAASRRDAVLGTTLASFFGFIVMTVIAIGIIGMSINGGGSGGGGSAVDVTNLLVEIAIASIPTMLVGGTTAALQHT
ncbi:MAG: hypothetical protein ABEI52_08180 [Halobacteriaceae archaeon]